MGLPSMEQTDGAETGTVLTEDDVRIPPSWTATLLLLLLLLLLLPVLEVMSYAQEEVIHQTMKVA